MQEQTSPLWAPLVPAISAALGGMPPADTISYALGGAVLGVWLEGRRAVVITPKWVMTTILVIFCSALAGIMGSAIVLAIAPAVPTLSFVGAWPRWALAGSIAFCIRWAAPLVINWARRRWGEPAPAAGGKRGGDTHA